MPARRPEMGGAAAARSGRGAWISLLVVGIALTVAALWPASELRIDARLEALLPEGEPAADDYRRFLEIFGGLEKLFVVVGGDEGGTPRIAAPDLIDAADALAERLAAAPIVRSARSGLEDHDETFFLERVVPWTLLLADRALWPALDARLEPAAIRERVALMRAHAAGPTGSFEMPLFAADPLGLLEVTGLPTPGAGAPPLDPGTGAFLSADGSLALIIVTPAVGELDSSAGRELLQLLEESYAAVREESGLPLVFHAVGGPLYAAQDERIIRGDLIKIVTGSAVGVTLLLALFFRGIRIPIALFLAVMAGIVWTGAVTRIAHGTVTVIGVSFASILLGLGVDYGIHGATRFRQNLVAIGDRSRAMRRTLIETGPAIVASAGTTMAGFLVLTLAHFAPVRELGLVVAGGIAAILAASLVVGAPALVVLPSSSGAAPRAPGLFWRAVDDISRRLVTLGHEHRRMVLAVAAVLCALSLIGTTRLEFNADLRVLRPDDHPALEAERRIVDGFDMGLDTFTVVLDAIDLPLALGAADAAATALRATMGDDVVVSSPSDWLVGGGSARQALEHWSGPRTQDALRTLEQELLAHGFNRTGFAPALSALGEIARGRMPQPPPAGAWPDWLHELVHIGARRVDVALRARAPVGRLPGGPSEETLRALADLQPNAAVASVPRLAAGIRNLVGADLRRLGGWALLAIVAVAAISFRGRLRPTLLAVTPVLLGSLWMLGLCGFLGIRIDPFSMTVVPLLLGIGIDDGLHAVHGIRDGGLVASLHRTRLAMSLTTLTTCVGFGTLVFSRVPALRTGGFLVMVGVISCLICTLTLLAAAGRPRDGSGPER